MFSIGSAVAATVALAAPVAHALPTYILYYLGDSPATPDPNPAAPTTQPDRQVVGLGINNAVQTTGCVENSASSFPPGFCKTSDPSGDATAFRGTRNVVAPLYPITSSATSIGLAINNGGKIAGWSYTDAAKTNYRAFRDNGGSVDIIAPLAAYGDTDSVGNAINASGVVAGYSAQGTGPGTIYHAFRHGVATEDLQSYGGLGGTQSEGKAINASGTVTGWATTNALDTIVHAFGQSGVAAMVDLGTGGFKTHSFGQWINDSGTVAGCATGSSGGCSFGDSRTIIADAATAGSAVDILMSAPLPAGISSSANSGANDINASDIVVGWVENGTSYANPNPCNQDVCGATLFQTRAYWYDDATGVLSLVPLLPADPDLTGLLFRQVAQAINNDGIMVGYQEMWVDHDASLATPPVLRRHGWIYDIDTTELVDIDADILSLVPGLDPNWDGMWRFTNGFDIAESGAILTFCRFVNDAAFPDGTELRTCVLEASEPASFASFAAGLAALGLLGAGAAVRRRRARA